MSSFPENVVVLMLMSLFMLCHVPTINSYRPILSRRYLHTRRISKAFLSINDNNLAANNHSIGQVMLFLQSMNNTLTNSDKNFKDFNETLSVTLKEFRRDIKAEVKMELNEFKRDMKIELDEFRNEMSAEVDNLSNKMSSGFSDIRKSMGRIFESGMRSDLSTSAIYSSTYIQPININSIMELVSLLPGDDEKPMSVEQQFLVARNVTKAIMVTLFTEEHLLLYFIFTMNLLQHLYLVLISFISFYIIL